MTMTWDTIFFNIQKHITIDTIDTINNEEEERVDCSQCQKKESYFNAEWGY